MLTPSALNGPLVVEDAETDPRFRDNPLVLGIPNIRFYAGAPIMEEGRVIDTVPRQLSPKQTSALEALARQVQTLLEQRRVITRAHEDATTLAATTETLRESEERMGLAAEAAGIVSWFRPRPQHSRR